MFGLPCKVNKKEEHFMIKLINDTFFRAKFWLYNTYSAVVAASVATAEMVVLSSVSPGYGAAMAPDKSRVLHKRNANETIFSYHKISQVIERVEKSLNFVILLYMFYVFWNRLFQKKINNFNYKNSMEKTSLTKWIRI